MGHIRLGDLPVSISAMNSLISCIHIRGNFDKILENIREIRRHLIGYIGDFEINVGVRTVQTKIDHTMSSIPGLSFWPRPAAANYRFLYRHADLAYILFDTNVATNHKVTAARNALALELVHRGAEVWFVDLPQEEGINGIDDYLGRHGCGPAMELFNAVTLFDPREKLASLTFTDFGNEQAFQILFGEDYLYNFTSLQWLHWQGNYWEPDFTNTVDRAMLEVAAARLQATALLPDVEPPSTGKNVSDKQKAVKASLRLQDVQKRKAAIESARSNPHFARRAEDFDSDDLLVACGNGVIDLRTGGFRAGLRSDMLTKVTSVYWVPEAECNAWTKFLSEVFPEQPEMWRFLQTAVGYSLSGSTREEVFFILSGRGRNGKGTFLRALTALLGDYAATTEFSTLISDPDRRKGVRNDIAALAGKRFVTAQESREGAHFDESLIKTPTGGDLITARFLNKEFFTFRPSWKIWLATNHKPNIKGSDDGVWSRPRIIEFNVSFEGRENRGLKDELLRPAELSGILRWALKGWLDYQSNGLQYPKEVLQATAAYRAESDLVGRYIEDSCIKLGSCSAQARPLYQDFSKWRQEAGEPEMTETAFCKRLAEKGF